MQTSPRASGDPAACKADLQKMQRGKVVFDVLQPDDRSLSTSTRASSKSCRAWLVGGSPALAKFSNLV